VGGWSYRDPNSNRIGRRVSRRGNPNPNGTTRWVCNSNPIDSHILSTHKHTHNHHHYRYPPPP